jgi:hypothetical protein
MSMARKSYRVLVGVNYLPNGKGKDEKRAEPGDVVDDLPPSVVATWLEQQVIEQQVIEEASSVEP